MIVFFIIQCQCHFTGSLGYTFATIKTALPAKDIAEEEINTEDYIEAYLGYNC